MACQVLSFALTDWQERGRVMVMALPLVETGLFRLLRRGWVNVVGGHKPSNSSSECSTWAYTLPPIRHVHSSNLSTRQTRSVCRRLCLDSYQRRNRERPVRDRTSRQGQQRACPSVTTTTRSGRGRRRRAASMPSRISFPPPPTISICFTENTFLAEWTW